MEQLKSQLAAAEQEIKQACKFLVGNQLFAWSISSTFARTMLNALNILAFIAAILPDLPAGDGGVSLKDIMVILSDLHQLTQSAMEMVFHALWPKERLPEDQAALARRLQVARERIKTWKILACREGARQAWTMIQTHLPTLQLEKVARVGPSEAKVKEIWPNINFEKVMPFARIFEKDCRLDKLIHDL